MTQITLANFATKLRPSTQPIGSTPDGNVYFDTTAGTFQLITVDDLATMDMTDAQYGGGTASDANELTVQDGVLLAALYAFEKQERKASPILNEDLRQYDKYFAGSYKFAGAYEIINSRKPFSDAHRDLLRGSGWIERASDGVADRIYFGGRSLGNVEALSQPYVMIGNAQTPNAFTPTDYAKDGPVDEAVQVLGKSDNDPVDASAGDFDDRAYYAMSVRTYGQNFSRKILTDSGLSQSDGYSSGFAIVETAHLTTLEATYPIADAGTQPTAGTGTMLGLELQKEASPVSRTGFATADKDFSWTLLNPNSLSLDACVAFLDAISTQDNDIDSSAETTTFGKRVDTWYSYNAAGTKIITRSGAGDGLGLYIQNIQAADDQRVIQTSDDTTENLYAFFPLVEVTVGANAEADSGAWYHAYYADGAGAADFNTVGAVVVLDKDDNPVKGNIQADVIAGKISFQYDYANDTDAGLSSGVDKDIIFEVEGDGVATAAQTPITIKNQTVSATCAPGLETNT